MPRKKRRTLIVVSVVLVILIIATALVLLYLKTDMFKSNKMLFSKYMSQNAENVVEAYAKFTQDDYDEQLKESKYTSKTRNKSKLY